MYGDRSWIKATVQSLYYIGQMTGSLFCGIMGDKCVILLPLNESDTLCVVLNTTPFRIGRKRVFYLAIVIQTVCGSLLTVAPTWWLFAFLK